MEFYVVTVSLQSAFGTSLKGDTLFGQLCWAIRNRLGMAQLQQCLEGYINNSPFAVISDAFPENYLPLPKLPSCFYQLPAEEDRKSIKKRVWLAKTELQKPLDEWLLHAVNAKQIAGTVPENAKKLALNSLSELYPQPHNTINRLSNTTGDSGFAPYSSDQEWFIPDLRWHIYLLLDTAQLSLDDCKQCLSDIGDFGYGRDASIGMGKFKIENFQAASVPDNPKANACLTLAPCAPQGLNYDPQHSYYQLFTRFGRHGDIAVHQHGKPFKNPVLLAETGALFATTPPKAGFIGQGIGGKGELSKTLPETVHQGYAPVIAVQFNAKASL